jgi:crotonobetainyl-CoA:carnitine CoA-transferase CaiB-like acyl-CoA transferase
MSGGILCGIRIIELCGGVAGSVAALQLSEAGAEVIKIEPPGGDPDRMTPGFAVRNRGKKSVVLDIDAADGRSALQRLMGASDVLIHDLTPAVATACGLGDSALAESAAHLIVAGVTGWPVNHPDAERPALETLVLARLGLLSEQPGARPGPIFVRMPFATHAASWLCAIGVMSRLIQRRQGRGVGPAHTSLAQGALTPMTMHWARAERPSESFAKGIDRNLAVAIHPCADGKWIHVHYAPDEAPFMREGLEALGPKGVAQANARWGKNHAAPNLGANREVFGTRPLGEWLEHLWANDIAAQPAAAFGGIYFDEQSRINGYVVEIEDARFGATVQPGPPYATEPPPCARGPLRPLGADTAAVLADDRAALQGYVAAGHEPPLAGLKALDFGAYVAGPFGAMLLADLGVDVIKIEPPSGDFMRYLDRVFCGVQRGKRSVALQLKDPRSGAALEALVRWADCFHHNIRMPAARKLGLGYEAMSRINPAIVGCHVSSYGPKGERADWPGFDQLFQASCGWEVENGGPGNPPLWLRFGITDHLAAMASVYALLLGLYARERTGRGQMTNASLLGATILTTAETIVHPDGSIEPFDRLDQGQTGVSAHHRIYRCADGWIAVAALAPHQARAFDTVAGDSPAAFFAGQAAISAAASLDGAGAPCELVREDQLDAFLDNPDTRAAGLVADCEHLSLGRLDQVGGFWTFGAHAGARRPPPAIGQHTREALQQVGLSVDDIDGLIAAGLSVEPPARSAGR